MDESGQKRGEFDLPLSSNFSDIQVHHYMIYLKCDLCNKLFQGSTTIFFTQQIKRDHPLPDPIVSKGDPLPDPLVSKRDPLPDPIVSSDINSGIFENTILQSDSDNTIVEEKELDKSTSKIFAAKLSSETKPVNNNIKSLDEKCRVISVVGKTSIKRKVTDKENAAAVCQNKHLKQSVSIKDDTNIHVSYDTSQQSFDCEETDTIKDFILILDCHELEIQSVSEAEITTSIDAETLSSPHWSTDKGQTSENLLQYDLGDQCLKIKVPCQKDSEDNLRAIKISYKTTADGQSLKWTKDQDGKSVLFLFYVFFNRNKLAVTLFLFI